MRKGGKHNVKLKGKMNIDFKKDWKFFTILLASMLLMVLFTTYLVSVNNKFYDITYSKPSTGVVEGISTGTVIEQQFMALGDYFEKVILHFEPYADDYSCGGEATIGIKDAEGTILKEEKITRNHIKSSPNYELKFQRQQKSFGKQYTIYIRFDDLKGKEKFYTLAMTNENESQVDKLYYNGEIQENSAIIYQTMYRNQETVSIFWMSLILLLPFTFLLTTILYYQKNKKVETIFLLVVPIISVVFMLAMPTLKNHDEQWHWLKAFEVSEGNLMTPIREDGTQGSMAPKGAKIFTQIAWRGITYDKLDSMFEMRLDKEEKELIDPYTSAFYSCVSYLPQAIGIRIARLFTDRAYLIAYAGRVTNLISAMTLLYFAIKLMPFGKKLLLIPAMIPIAIEGFSSLSPDAITISVSFLFIAYVFHLAFGEKTKVQWKEKILLLLMSIVIALSKIVYLPLVGLILIIPKEKFKKENNKSKVLNFLFIAGIATIVNLIWLAIAGKYLANFQEGASSIKIIQALQNPIRFGQMILYSMVYGLSTDTLSLFGTELGYFEFVKLYSLVPYVFIGLYLFVAVTDKEIKNKLKRYQVVWILLVVLATILLLFMSLYVHWTVVGSTYIQGIQGRYFLPILPLVMLLIGHSLKNIQSTYEEEHINKVVGISGLLLNLFAILQILISNMSIN